MTVASSVSRSPTSRCMISTAIVEATFTVPGVGRYLLQAVQLRDYPVVQAGALVAATALTAASWNLGSFLVFRFLTGAGIGGEYAAINSAIQEFVPARFRGRVDLGVNGSFWVGAAMGALGAVVLLKPGVLPDDVGWRAAFGIGAVLGLGILALRRFVPESPRWLMIHGRIDEANAVIDEIERRVGATEPLEAGGGLRLVPVSHLSTVGMIAAILPLLYVERGAQMTFVLQSCLLLVSGVYYSISILPGWMQVLSHISPATYVLDGVRAGLIDGVPITDLFGDIWPLLVMGVTLIPLGVWAFGRAERYAKRTGKLKRVG